MLILQWYALLVVKQAVYTLNHNKGQVKMSSSHTLHLHRNFFIGKWSTVSSALWRTEVLTCCWRSDRIFHRRGKSWTQVFSANGVEMWHNWTSAFSSAPVWLHTQETHLKIGNISSINQQTFSHLRLSHWLITVPSSGD